MKANYHTHTWRCHHADGQDEDYIRAALEAGFEELGFADHSPWPFAGGFVSGIRMTCDQLPDYIGSLHALREKYAGRLSIRLGLESEYFPRYHDHLLRMRDAGIEYFILGQHYPDSEEDHPYIGGLCREDSGVMQYAEAVVRGIRTGLYSYVAHADLLMGPRPDGDFNAACMQATDMICQAAKEQGIPLEYNLLGLVRRIARGDQGGYPCPPFWEYARKWHVPAIIGVDAHAPQELNNPDIWNRAQKTLTDLGYEIIDHLDLEASR